MDAEPFSFSALDKRIVAMPDGPIATLNRPRWQYWTDLGGGLGVIIGLLPSLIVQFYEPKPWMVTMALTGLTLMGALFLPGVLRGMWAFACMIRRGRQGHTAQLDHDFAEFNAIHAWLATFSRQTLEQHLRFVQVAQLRLSAKLSLMGGGLDRFGILPLILAVGVQIKAFTADSLALPLWQIVPGLFFAIGYLVGLNGVFMRVRMHMYEVLLAEALERRGVEKPAR